MIYDVPILTEVATPFSKNRLLSKVLAMFESFLGKTRSLKDGISGLQETEWKRHKNMRKFRKQWKKNQHFP
ncbi:hypothetical protein SOVF_062320 isoform B, partial [Spinacia oleracea]